ncbi:MAG: M42 family metallopeptidase [Clostridia bacterium]|nr:M42 family metallopeptidase [Clostridia bacterium]
MELLKELSLFNATSGREAKLSDFIKNIVKDYADEVYSDSLGNLIAHKKGSGKKIMLSAHMDEIGVVVTYIEDSGYLRFADVGGLYTKYLAGRRVVFESGTEGVIFTEPKNDKNALSKMYIDIGATSKEDAEKCVNVGDMGAFCGNFTEQNGVIIGKALDDRVGCLALIETLKRVKSENDLYFVFTVQEEVGLRGARTAAFAINPDFALAVDVTDSGDTPKCDKVAVKLGLGAAIKVMDYSVICDKEVKDTLILLAEKKNIKYQLEVMTEGGTDAGVIHFSRGGVKTGGVSIPTRYIHSPSEMINKDDLTAVIDLITAFCEN